MTNSVEKLRPFASVAEAENALQNVGYFADRATATAAYLALAMSKPLLLEGPAGVGKTALAQALAQSKACALIRLQCYEGLDESKALYEWDYAKQMLLVQLVRNAANDGVPKTELSEDLLQSLARVEQSLFQEQFLLKRPLLQALHSAKPVVLLVDEVDRADPEFEAMLLELLSEFQVSVPELGTLRATSIPTVILTSNGSRDLSDALRRRCLYHFMGYPTPSTELEIVRRRVPEASERLSQQVIAIAQATRTWPLRKTPAISETIEWTRALVLLGAQVLDRETLEQSLSALSKFSEDRELILERVEQGSVKLSFDS